MNNSNMKHHEELLEIRRKMIHLLVGVFIASFVWLRLVDATLLLSFSFFLLGFFLLLKEFHWKIPFLFSVLRIFEREKHIQSFPGKSAICFLFGCALSVFLFPRDIAVASILILAFGDSLSNLIGHHFGKIITPLHPVKKIEGPLVASIISGIIASFFVPLVPALVASFGAMALEIPEWKIFGIHIDDNIIIPFVSGTILLFFGW